MVFTYTGIYASTQVFVACCRTLQIFLVNLFTLSATPLGHNLPFSTRMSEWERAQQPGATNDHSRPRLNSKSGAKAKNEHRNSRIASAYGTSVARSKRRHSQAAGRRDALAERALDRSNTNRQHNGQASKDSRRDIRIEKMRTGKIATGASKASSGQRHKPRAQTIYTKKPHTKPQISAEQRILEATADTRAINDDENTLDYEALSGYIDELKTKLDETNGAGGGNRESTRGRSSTTSSSSSSSTSASLSVHQISKVKKRILGALSHEQKVEAMLRSGKYRPSSNLMKGAQPARKKVVSSAPPPPRRRKASTGNPYGNNMASRHSKLRGSSEKNQWGEWLDEFEAKSFKWFEKSATYVRAGPSSGKLQRAFCADFPDDAAAEAGDPYASLRSTIILPPRRPQRKLNPGQRVKKKPKVQYGRNCKIRNDGR